MSFPALLAALALTWQGTTYIPPGATPPSEGGDIWVLGQSDEGLYLGIAHPIAFEPGKVRAVTLVTIYRRPETQPGGRVADRHDMGLIFDCAARTTQITGSALWDKGGLGIEVRGPVRGSHAVPPSSSVGLAYGMMCQGKGEKRAGQYMHDIVARWRATGRP